MRIASRYLATVRRAMSMPEPRKQLDDRIVGKDGVCRFGVDQPRECGGGLPRRNARRRRSAEAIAAVKKYFISKMPRVVAMYLFEVTRDTVDSCMPIASATVLRLSGPEVLDAVGEEGVLLADDLGGDLEDGAGPLVEAFDQPVGGLQAVG